MIPGSVPYPGLRPFSANESHIFFGREEHTDELLNRLARTRFLTIVGPSGCGKSSLVRAGMVAGLECGFMATAGTRWRVATLRPGSHPIRRLAAALVEESALGPYLTDDPHAQAFMYATLTRGPLGLVEVLRDTKLEEQTNLVVLVDQFEELFRYPGGRSSDEAHAFVGMLLESAAQTEVPIYIVITMRSDFLGDCARFSGLPEAMNDGQYLTPRLTRDQRRAAIEGPARVFDGEVEPALVNALLNDMGSDPDQLPLMQHVLMRLWLEATAKHASTPGSGSPQPIKLTLHAYEAGGRLRTRLSNDADEAYNELDAGGQALAEVMFRTLTERGPQERDTRRPASIQEITAVAGLPPDEHTRVKQVAEVFRRPDRSFITPTAGEPLYESTVLDISHESLIRQWRRLTGWVDEEAKSAWTYGRLREQANLWAEGRGGLWSTPDLENGLAWREKTKPSDSWAQRYGGDFDRSMEFLQASQRRQAVVKRRRMAAIAGSFAAMVGIAVGSSIMAGIARDQKNQAEDQRKQATLRATLNEGFKALEEDPERGLLLALYTAERIGPGQDGMVRETEDLLRRAVQSSRVRLAASGANPIKDLAYSPDGQRIAVAGAGGQAAIIDAVTGKTLVNFEGHDEDVTAIGFSPDGRRLVTGSREFAFHAGIWDASTGAQLIRLEGHKQTVGRAVFNHSGNRVATASADNTAKVWDAATGKLVFSLDDHQGWVWGVAFSPNDSLIATGSLDSTVRVWDARQGSLERTLPKSAAGVLTVVFSPDGKLIASGDEAGYWGLYDVATGNRLHLLTGQRQGLWDVSFSSDGKLLATASYDGTVQLWDPQSGDSMRQIVHDSTNTAGVNAIAFSPAGTELAASGDDGRISFWNLADGKPLRTSSKSPTRLNALALSPDGTTMVTGGFGNVAELWDLDTGSRLESALQGHYDPILGVAFSPDGSRIATASADATTLVWDVKSREQLQSLSSREGRVLAVGFSANGDRIVTGGDAGIAYVWDAQSGDRLLSLRPGLTRGTPPKSIRAVQYSPNGKYIATGGDDGMLSLWNASNGEPVLQFESDSISNVVHDVAFSPDGRRVAAANWGDQTVKVWDVGSRKRLLTLIGHTGPVMAVAYSRDGNRIASAGYDRIVRVWDANSGRELFRLPGHLHEIHDVGFTPDGEQVASVSWDGTWRLWDLTSNPEWGSLRADSVRTDQIAYSPDGSLLATIGSEGVAKLWDAQSGDSVRAFGFLGSALAFSPDGTVLATNSGLGFDLNLYDVRSGKWKKGLASHTGSILRIGFDKSGRRIATTSTDSTARLWETKSGKEIDSIKVHRNWVFALSFDPADSTRLVTGGRDNIGTMWSVLRHEPIFKLFGHRQGVWDVGFDPKGRMLASAGGDGTIRVWSADSGRALISPMKGHTSPVSKIAFSPDGGRLASASWDGTVKVWDVHNGSKEFGVSIGGRANWVTFSPDGSRLAVAGNDGKVWFYAAGLDALLAVARTRVTRSFTGEECRVYLRAETCPDGAVEQIIRGREQAREGDLAGAASSFSSAARHDPRLQGDSDAARYLVTQGEALALQGDLSAATASFQAAQQIQPELHLEPGALARRKVADYNAARARSLRRSGDIAAADERLRRANELNPVRKRLATGHAFAEQRNFDSAAAYFLRTKELDPKRNLTSEADILAERARVLTRANTDKITDAITLYSAAEALDSSQITADQWNSLCWYGTLWGHVERVMRSCQRAVELGGDSTGYIRDSRALALAATGRGAEAIGDFEAYVAWASIPAERLMRQMWVDSLRAGKNPMTSQVLEALRIVDLTPDTVPQAATELRRAVSLYPGYLATHQSLARVYLRQRKVKQGVRELRKVDSLGLSYRGGRNILATYAGTVTNKGLPTQPGSFEVRFERTEPEPSGVILIGEPLYGSAPFEGVWKGDSLIFWSLAATGDTIRWAAKPAGNNLSGKYEILGGAAGGQGGTWKTRLAHGSRVSETRSSRTVAATTVGPEGTWSGEWTGSGYVYTLEMDLRLASDNAVRAAIVWTLKASPERSDSLKIRRRATEFAGGQYDPQTRRVTVEGYGTDDPESLISPDRYDLRLSADGATLSGRTWNRGTWDGAFAATRTLRETAASTSR